MSFRLLIPACFLLLTGCLRPDAELYGTIRISGAVTDAATGAPVAGSVIWLCGDVQKQGPLGYSNEEERLGADTTDAAGTYSFDYEARGETAYRVTVVANDAYMQQPDALNSNEVRGVGEYTQNLRCVRTAFARVELQNVATRDTARVSLIGPVNAYHLSKLYRDTILTLRIYGDRTTKSAVSLSYGSSGEQKRELTAGAGDTVRISFDY